MNVPIFSLMTNWLGGRMPVVIGIIATLIAVIPLHLPGGLQVAPLYPLMVVFFWGMHRGDLMTPGRIFFIGLLFDLLSGAPLGLWSLIFLACHAVALVLRDLFGRALRTSWAVFAITCITASVLAWSMLSIYEWTLINPAPFAVQCMVSVGLYPFFGYAFAFIERYAVSALRA